MGFENICSAGREGLDTGFRQQIRLEKIQAHGGDLMAEHWLFVDMERPSLCGSQRGFG